jgi:hypothetical protein
MMYKVKLNYQMGSTRRNRTGLGKRDTQSSRFLEIFVRDIINFSPTQLPVPCTSIEIFDVLQSEASNRFLAMVSVMTQRWIVRDFDRRKRHGRDSSRMMRRVCSVSRQSRRRRAVQEKSRRGPSSVFRGDKNRWRTEQVGLDVLDTAGSELVGVVEGSTRRVKGHGRVIWREPGSSHGRGVGRVSVGIC